MILPCLVIGTIEIVTFLVPYDDTDRLNLSFTCLLAYLMFQMMIMSQLPNAAENPPLLLLLISLFTVYIGVAIVFQGICIYLVDMTKYDPESKPSRKIQKLALLLAKIITPDSLKQVNIKKNRKKLRNLETGISVNNEIFETHGRLFYLPAEDESFLVMGVKGALKDKYKKQAEANWDLVAKVVDKCGFIIFISLLLGTIFALLVFIPLGKNWGMD